MSEVIRKVDKSKMKATLLALTQAIEKGERMQRAGLDVTAELEQLKEARDSWQKLWDEYGKT